MNIALVTNGTLGNTAELPNESPHFSDGEMSKTWASELEESNVRVNWVDPGNMNTAMPECSRTR